MSVPYISDWLKSVTPSIVPPDPWAAPKPAPAEDPHAHLQNLVKQAADATATAPYTAHRESHPDDPAILDALGQGAADLAHATVIPTDEEMRQSGNFAPGAFVNHIWHQIGAATDPAAHLTNLQLQATKDGSTVNFDTPDEAGSTAGEDLGNVMLLGAGQPELAEGDALAAEAPKMPHEEGAAEKWGTLTWENPGGMPATAEKNAEYMAALHKTLDERGIDYTPTEGKYTDPTTGEVLKERGVHITGESPETIAALGREGGQNGVIHHEGYHDLTTDQVAPLKGTSAVGEDAPIYTDLGHGKRFVGDFDWENQKPFAEKPKDISLKPFSTEEQGTEPDNLAQFHVMRGDQRVGHFSAYTENLPELEVEYLRHDAGEPFSAPDFVALTRALKEKFPEAEKLSWTRAGEESNRLGMKGEYRFKNRPGFADFSGPINPALRNRRSGLLDQRVSSARASDFTRSSDSERALAKMEKDAKLAQPSTISSAPVAGLTDDPFAGAKPSTPMYHVTLTKNVPKIEKSGIRPLQPSNWTQAGSGERYGNGDIFAFNNKEDAHRWAAKMDWDFHKGTGTGKVSVVHFDPAQGQWTTDVSDPLSQLGAKGQWQRMTGHVPPEQILGAEPFTRADAKALVEGNTGMKNRPGFLRLPQPGDKLGLSLKNRRGGNLGFGPLSYGGGGAESVIKQSEYASTRADPIVAAAIKTPNGEIHTGITHAHAYDAYGESGGPGTKQLADLAKNTPSYAPMMSEGFVTKSGRYLTREEAEAELGRRPVAELMKLDAPATGGGLLGQKIDAFKASTQPKVTPLPKMSLMSDAARPTKPIESFLHTYDDEHTFPPTGTSLRDFGFGATVPSEGRERTLMMPSGQIVLLDTSMIPAAKGVPQELHNAVHIKWLGNNQNLNSTVIRDPVNTLSREDMKLLHDHIAESHPGAKSIVWERASKGGTAKADRVVRYDMETGKLSHLPRDVVP